MLTKILRLIKQIEYRFFTQACEPQYDVCIYTGTPKELRKILSPLGWGINDFSLAEKGQVLTLRKLDDFGHQYHLRLIKTRLDKKSSEYHQIIRIHYEWSWSDYLTEHENGVSRCLTPKEKDDFIRIVRG